MRRTALHLLLIFLTFFGVRNLPAQESRPLPYPVMPVPGFQKAIEQGTRTTDGRPGPNYWTNTAHYDIQATLSPDTGILKGKQVVRYWNNSPDTLQYVMVHLRQNLHREGVVRSVSVEITGGMHLSEVTVQGEELLERVSEGLPGYTIDGTIMRIELPSPLHPGNWVEFGFSWSFEVPERAPRMGREDGVFFLGYWYPQIAVYDDVNGWRADPYVGPGEFYMGYGTYDVSITLPSGWLVAATGALQNTEELFPGEILARLRQASYANEVIHIVTEQDLQVKSVTNGRPEEKLTWRYKAENVRDFAFSATRWHVWDATTAAVGDPDGDGQPDTAMIHAFYRPDADGWSRAAEYGQFSIEHLSELLLPYPYPHMTIVEGIIGGGMEYPMMTLIGSRGDESVFGTTYHEISHMWVPMIVGSDEKAFAWMDEGLTSFNTYEGRSAFYGIDGWDSGSASLYFVIAGTGDEIEPMRHTDTFPVGNRTAWRVAAYSKPALVLNALRGLVGQEQFYEAYRTYVERWSYKHPYPYDLFNTFEDILGEELDWFWSSLLYETWTLDLAIGEVNVTRESVEVTIVDEGLVPVPVPVRVFYRDGTTSDEIIPVQAWLEGRREATVSFPPGQVTRVQIDPEWFLPDVDRTDNVWVR